MTSVPKPTTQRRNSSEYLLAVECISSGSGFPDPLLLTIYPLCSLRSSQRNVYLTGFTLFLSLVLTRVFAIILDLIETQTAYAALKQQVRTPAWTRSTHDPQPPLSQAANNNRPGNDTLKAEIEGLKKELTAKTQDFGASSNILCLLNHAIYIPRQIL